MRIAAPALVGIAVLLAWHALVTAFGVPKYLVPSPVDVAQTLVADWGLLSAALLVTLRITFFALLCATVIGTLVAFAFVQSRLVEASFFPYAILLQVTPIVAIAPLIIIWVENIEVALVLCATIVAVFPIISNTTLGLRSVNRGLADLFRMNGATRLQTLVRLRIPSAAPYFFGGLRISSGLALIGAVVAEFVAGTGGPGRARYRSSGRLPAQHPRLFAALFLITVAGFCSTRHGLAHPGRARSLARRALGES
jgi:NitT/TauT family transport system permease protein